MDVRDRLITALDYPTFDQAKALVEELGDAVTFYKVGMELFYGAGPDIIRYLKDRNKKVFLDLKPRTSQYGGPQPGSTDPAGRRHHEHLCTPWAGRR